MPEELLGQTGAFSIDLRDIHLPESIHWWPIAPAWWILLATILLLLAALAVYWWKKSRVSHLKAVAQSEYDLIIDTSTENSSVRFSEMLLLLKKISKSHPQVESALSKPAEIWLAKLCQVLQIDQVSSELIRTIKSSPYQAKKHLETREIEVFTQTVIHALPENTRAYSVRTSVTES